MDDADTRMSASQLVSRKLRRMHRLKSLMHVKPIAWRSPKTPNPSPEERAVLPPEVLSADDTNVGPSVGPSP